MSSNPVTPTKRPAALPTEGRPHKIQKAYTTSDSEEDDSDPEPTQSTQPICIDPALLVIPHPGYAATTSEEGSEDDSDDDGEKSEESEENAETQHPKSFAQQLEEAQDEIQRLSALKLTSSPSHESEENRYRDWTTCPCSRMVGNQICGKFYRVGYHRLPTAQILTLQSQLPAQSTIDSPLSNVVQTIVDSLPLNKPGRLDILQRLGLVSKEWLKAVMDQPVYTLEGRDSIIKLSKPGRASREGDSVKRYGLHTLIVRVQNLGRERPVEVSRQLQLDYLIAHRSSTPVAKHEQVKPNTTRNLDTVDWGSTEIVLIDYPSLIDSPSLIGSPAHAGPKDHEEEVENRIMLAKVNLDSHMDGEY